jgi:hypothetical protein
MMRPLWCIPMACLLWGCNTASSSCPTGIFVSPLADCQAVCANSQGIAECLDPTCRTGAYRRLHESGWEEGGFVMTSSSVRQLWVMSGARWTLAEGEMGLVGAGTRQLAYNCRSDSELLVGELGVPWTRPSPAQQEAFARPAR